MIGALYIDYLRDGALPIYEAPTDSPYYCLQEGQWQPFTARRGRALIPLDLDTFLPNFEAALAGWLRVLGGLTEALGTLIFTLRTCCELEGARYILGALAFVPALLPDGTALDGEDPAPLLIQLCRGLTGEDSAQLHPALQATLARMLEDRARAEAERQADQEATARSLALLESFLNDEQRAEFREAGVFHVRTRDGRLFRFTKGFGHNVHLVQDGLCVTEYCIITTERVPLYDQMLGQKVLLEADPEDFFRIANFRQLQQPTPNPALPTMGEVCNILAQRS